MRAGAQHRTGAERGASRAWRPQLEASLLPAGEEGHPTLFDFFGISHEPTFASSLPWRPILSHVRAERESEVTAGYWTFLK